MAESVNVIQLTAEGVTQGFIAKGDIRHDVMVRSCKEQFKPSQYEDEVLNLDKATVVQGHLRWVPATDEYGDPCGSRLITARSAGHGAFFGTQLVLLG